MKNCLRPLVLAVAACLATGATGAADAGALAGASPEATAQQAPAVVARYRLSLTPPGGVAAPAPVDWYFHRSAHALHLIKGDIEEIWTRDGAGRVSFERVFHADRRRVFYTPGELRTLGIAADWGALATLMARPEPTPAAASASGGGEVVWDDHLQLPARVVRTLRSGTLVMALEAAHPVAPAGWPAASSGVGDYDRLDGADLGDMEYDAFARKAEAMDVRAGWRMAHEH